MARKDVHLQIAGGSLIINGLFGAAARFRCSNSYFISILLSIAH